MSSDTAHDQGTMKLVIEDDEGRRTVVPITRSEITIGRKDGNTIRLTERNVSRFHARLLRQELNIFIEDLNSYTGVRINGDRISGRVQVAEGDLIEIGDYHLALQAEGGAEALAAQATAEATVRDANPSLGEETVKVPMPADTPQAPAPMAAPAPIPEVPLAAEAMAPAAVPDITPTPDAPEVPEAVAAPEVEPPAKRPEPTAIIRPDQIEADAQTSSAGEIPENDRAKLVVVATGLAGQEFALTRREMVIGRTDDNDVTLDHRSVSRHHAKVVFGGSSYSVVDLKSANGVLVNGEEYTQTVLRPGDIVELGHVQLRFIEPGGRFELTAEEIAAIKAEAAEIDGVESYDSGVTATARFARGPVDAELRRRRTFIIVGVAAAVVLILIVLIVALSGGDGKQPVTDDPGVIAENPTPTDPVDPIEPVAPVDPETPDDPVEAPVALGPEEIDAKLAQAREHIQQGDLERADAILGEVRSADPQNAQAQTMIEQVVKERAAKEDFETCQADAEAQRYEDALERCKEVPQGTLYREQAVKLAAKIRTDMAKEHESRASEAFAEEQLEDALEHVNKGLAYSPRDRGLKTLRKRIKAAQKEAAKEGKPAKPKKPREAKKPREEKPTKGNFKPEDAKAFYNAGNRFILQGRFKEAVDQFKLALKADPRFADAHRGLGIAYARLGKADMAVRHYEHYLKARPYAQDAAKVQEILKNYRKSR